MQKGIRFVKIYIKKRITYNVDKLKYRQTLNIYLGK